MQFEILFVGVGATLIGTVIGALIGPFIIYPFHKRLLSHQLEFLKKLSEDSDRQRKELSKEEQDLMKTVRSVLRDLSKHVASLGYHIDKNNNQS